MEASDINAQRLVGTIVSFCAGITAVHLFVDAWGTSRQHLSAAVASAALIVVVVTWLIASLALRKVRLRWGAARVIGLRRYGHAAFAGLAAYFAVALVPVSLVPAPQPPTNPVQKAPATGPPSPLAHLQPLTLRDLFRTDMGTALKSRRARILGRKDGTKVEIEEQLYLDMTGRSMFVGFYVPAVPDTHRFCEYLALNHSLPVSMAEGLSGGGSVGENTKGTNLTFTSRVYIYHEAALSNEQVAALTHFYRNRHLDVIFRGPNYLALQLITQNAPSVDKHP